MTSEETLSLKPDVDQLLREFEETPDPGGRFENTVRELRRRLRRCESPIEHKLLIEITCLLTASELTHFCHIAPQIWAYYTDWGSTDAALVRGVRLDFLVCFNTYWRNLRWSGYEQLWPPDFHLSLLPLFAVECDGQDYHTHEEQIQRDKTRDRILTGLGLTTIRFTGSDINSRPRACAIEVFNLFSLRLQGILENGVNLEEFVSFDYLRLPPGNDPDTSKPPTLAKFKRLYLSDRKHDKLLGVDASYMNDAVAFDLGLSLA